MSDERGAVWRIGGEKWGRRRHRRRAGATQNGSPRRPCSPRGAGAGDWDHRSGGDACRISGWYVARRTPTRDAQTSHARGGYPANPEISGHRIALIFEAPSSLPGATLPVPQFVKRPQPTHSRRPAERRAPRRRFRATASALGVSTSREENCDLGPPSAGATAESAGAAAFWGGANTSTPSFSWTRFASQTQPRGENDRSRRPVFALPLTPPTKAPSPRTRSSQTPSTQTPRSP